MIFGGHPPVFFMDKAMAVDFAEMFKTQDCILKNKWIAINPTVQKAVLLFSASIFLTAICVWPNDREDQSDGR
jgi:hypothetical protein